MDKPSLNIVRAADIAAHAQEFSHPWNSNSEMRGTQLARSVGLKRTGVNFIRVPAGKESYVYHSHQYEEEWIYVLSGHAVALIDDAEYEAGADRNHDHPRITQIGETGRPNVGARIIRGAIKIDLANHLARRK